MDYGNIFSIERHGNDDHSNIPRRNVEFISLDDLDFSRVNNTSPWIIFGRKNRWPHFLLDLASKSVLHRALLITKRNMIAGGGIELKGDNENKVKEAIKFFKEIKLFTEHKKIAEDMAFFGGSYAQIINKFDEDANSGTNRIIKMRYEEMRLGKPDKIEGVEGMKAINKHWMHKDWRAPLIPSTGEDADNSGDRFPKSIPSFDFDTLEEIDRIKNNKRKNVSYYLTSYSNIYKFYSIPDYQTQPGINSILIDGEIVTFNISQLKNGLTASYIVTFFRKDYTEEDKKKEKELRQAERDMVINDLLGSENAGNVVITRALPSAPDQKSMEITEIPSVGDTERLEFLRRDTNIQILEAHGFVMPELAGIPNLSKSGFSNKSDELITALEIIRFNRIVDLQEPVIDFYNNLLVLNGFQNEDEGSVTASIDNNIPISRTISDEMWQWLDDENGFRVTKGLPLKTDDEIKERRTERLTKSVSNSDKNNGNN